MNHNPIALGFAAFSAMTIMAACNPDPNRINPNAADRNQKIRCSGQNAADTQAVIFNRKSQIGDYQDSKVRNILFTKGSLLAFEQYDVMDTPTKTDSEAGVFRVEKDCDNLKASLQLPSFMGKVNGLYAIVSEISGGDSVRIDNLDIKKIDHRKIELERGDLKVTVDIQEVDGSISELLNTKAVEDGKNSIRVTFQVGDGENFVLINQSVAQSTEDVIISKADFDTIMTDIGDSATQSDVATSREKLRGEVAMNLNLYNLVGEKVRIPTDLAGKLVDLKTSEAGGATVDANATSASGDAGAGTMNGEVGTEGGE